MSDLHDPPEDSLEQGLQRPVDPATDKRIVFGARKPTEDAVALIGFPMIIEAPFPYERTLQWLPVSSTQDKSVVAETLATEGSTDDEAAPTTVASDGAQAESVPNEKPHESITSPFEIGGNTAILVSQEVLLKVNEHVSQSLERELGGFLLGNRYRCPNTPRDYVIIDQFSPAKFTESTEVNLAFTHEAWAQLSDELSGKFLGKLLIGWYHSHPRMDVFLSSHDMGIQTERFPEPWMVALVIEPEKHRGGFFCARDGRVKPNSPVDFFELLERNCRDSVLAWENYAAVDSVTNSTPSISATNTANPVNASSPETLAARSHPSKGGPRQRRRGRLLFAVVGFVLLLAAVVAGVAKRQSLKSWWQTKAVGVPTMQQAPTPEPQVPASPQQSPTTDEAPSSQLAPSPEQMPSPQQVPTTDQQLPDSQQLVPRTEQRVSAKERLRLAKERRLLAAQRAKQKRDARLKRR